MRSHRNGGHDAAGLFHLAFLSFFFFYSTHITTSHRQKWISRFSSLVGSPIFGFGWAVSGPGKDVRGHSWSTSKDWLVLFRQPRDGLGVEGSSQLKGEKRARLMEHDTPGDDIGRKWGRNASKALVSSLALGHQASVEDVGQTHKNGCANGSGFCSPVGFEDWAITGTVSSCSCSVTRDFSPY